MVLSIELSDIPHEIDIGQSLLPEDSIFTAHRVLLNNAM